MLFKIPQGHGGLAPYVVLQMDPGEPEPAPAPGEPSAPAALPNPEPLIPDEERMSELRGRLAINSLKRNWTPEEVDKIVETQLSIEKLIEKALLSDGASPETLLAKSHQIRGLLFYPKGTALSGKTYGDYLVRMENYGTHRSIPYRRIVEAIYNMELDLPLPPIKKR